MRDINFSTFLAPQARCLKRRSRASRFTYFAFQRYNCRPPHTNTYLARGRYFDTRRSDNSALITRLPASTNASTNITSAMPG